MWTKELTKITCQDELWCSFQCTVDANKPTIEEEEEKKGLKMIFKTKLHPPEMWSESNRMTSYKLFIIIPENILSVTLTHVSTKEY